MSQDNSQERSLPPTPKRRLDAAKKGQVIRSRELNTLLVTLGGAATIMALGSGALDSIRHYTIEAFGFALTSPAAGPHPLGQGLKMARDELLNLVIPVAAILVVLAVCGPVVTGGVRLRWKSALPKLSNLSVLKGLKRMVSARALMELLKAALKFLLLAAAAVGLLKLSLPNLLALGQQPLELALAQSGHLLLWFFVLLAATLIIIAAIDLPFQAHRHLKQLRMTRRELQDEMKETEGRPEVKRRIRSLQIQAAQRRFAKVIPEATVVVTNPTHYAVALRYDDEVDAPVVLARGAGVLAQHIRALAERFDVPVVSAPPLARALYFSVPEGRAIPSELYRAVSQVLIYVFQLGAGVRASPDFKEADIPPHLRRGEN